MHSETTNLSREEGASCETLKRSLRKLRHKGKEMVLLKLKKKKT